MKCVQKNNNIDLFSNQSKISVIWQIYVLLYDILPVPAWMLKKKCLVDELIAFIVRAMIILIVY